MVLSETSAFYFNPFHPVDECELTKPITTSTSELNFGYN